MKRQLLKCSLLVWLATTTGCAVCGSPFDYTYSTYGGKWQRDDETSGRVGSLFEPAGPTPPAEGEFAGPSGAPTPSGENEPAGGSVPPSEGATPLPPLPRSADAAPVPSMLFN